MPVGRRRADPGPARRVGEGEPGRPLLRDQVERGADERLAQIAVMIAAPAITIVAGSIIASSIVTGAGAIPLLRPAHVRGRTFRVVFRGAPRMPIAVHQLLAN